MTDQKKVEITEARQRDIRRNFVQLCEILSRNEEYYVNQKKINKIAGLLIIIFGPIAIITLFLTGSYPESDLLFAIFVVSFVLGFLNNAVASGIVKLEQKLFSPKSS